MTIIYGKVFSLVEENPPISGCTTSETLMNGSDFSVVSLALGEGTGISDTIYDIPRLWISFHGSLEVNGKSLPAGSLYAVPLSTPVSIRAGENSVYEEIILPQGTFMKNVIQDGEIKSLKDLIPSGKGKIINRDLVDSDTIMMAALSMDAGCALPAHAAPGEALITVLDGEGVMMYEGTDHPIHAGESFRMAKGGRHAVKAVTPFKMLLILEKEKR